MDRNYSLFTGFVFLRAVRQGHLAASPKGETDMNRWSAAVAAGLLCGTLHAETVPVQTCTTRSYGVSITNVSQEGMAGYVKGSTTVGFYVAPGETRDVHLPASEGMQEYPTQVYLQDNVAGRTKEDLADNRCAEYVLTPSGCPVAAPSAFLYLYQAKGEPRCFIRSAVRPHRPLHRLARKS
jgi:hypothetical protein